MSSKKDSDKKEIFVNCPKCKKKTLFDESNPTRPFCSQRCQLIDLGAWVLEKYSIESTDKFNSDQQSPSQNLDNDEETNSSDDLLN